MANTYAFTGPGERWAEGDPTAEDYLNVSRINVDHVHEALNVLMDTDAATGLLAGIGAVAAGDDMVWTSTVETGTDENAQKIIFVDLDDPLQLWDYAAFMQQIQDTSWHDSLGDPPVHGLMWITEAQTDVIWYNRETKAIYATITGATNGIFDDATPVLTGLDFKDGKIFACGTGGADATIIDLLRDGATKHSTAGISVFGGTLGSFAGTDGWVVYNATPAIVNDTVNAIAACRDPELTDEFNRPKHWWVVGTDGGASAYNPVADAIYDTTTVIHIDGLQVLSSGGLTNQNDQATQDGFNYTRSIFGIAVDGWGFDEQYINVGADSEDLAWSNAAVLNSPVAVEGASWASEGAPQLWLSSDEGLYVAHTHPSDNAGKGGKIRLSETYAGPYEKGDIRASWPLHAVTDIAPGGHDLTNNNTVTFASGGPAGSYADFVAASSMSLSVADHADFGLMTELSVFAWVNRDLDSAAIEALVSKWDSNAASYAWDLHVNASDGITANIYTSGGNDGVVSATSIISLAAWVYIGFTYDGTTITLWVNGVSAGTATGTASGTINDSTGAVRIGARDAASPTSFFDGKIGGVSISATAMAEREIKAEYQRGLRRINSGIDTNDTISDNDVVSIAADPHGKYVAVMGVDKVVYTLDEFAVPIATDTYPGTTARGVAIKSMGGVDPHYVMAGSDQIEIVQPNVRVGN